MEDVWITWSLEQNSSHGSRMNSTGEGWNELNLGYFSPLFGTYLAVEEWYVSANLGEIYKVSDNIFHNDFILTSFRSSDGFQTKTKREL